MFKGTRVEIEAGENGCLVRARGRTWIYNYPQSALNAACKELGLDGVAVGLVHEQERILANNAALVQECQDANTEKESATRDNLRLVDEARKKDQLIAQHEALIRSLNERLAAVKKTPSRSKR